MVAAHTRKLSVALVSVLLACNALAGWTPLRTTARGIDYIDTEPLAVERNLRRVSTLTDLARPDSDGDRAYRTLLEIDCNNTIYRSIESAFFAEPMASGKSTARTDSASPWRQAPDGSAAAAVMKLVCAKP